MDSRTPDAVARENAPDAAQAGTDERAAFGRFLRASRESRGLTLQQIAGETKIPLRHLDALERGNLSLLPDGLYRRAELRAYTKAVGLDYARALEWLTRLSQAPPGREAPVRSNAPRSRTRSRVDRSVLLGAGLLAVIALIGFARWSGSYEFVAGAAIDHPAIEA